MSDQARRPALVGADRDRPARGRLARLRGRSRLGLIAQVAAVLASWGWLCSMGSDSDGLWFPRDASIHMANGLFWLDYLEAFPEPPKAYAKAYQARYPIILPMKYPPLFYLAEAGAFRILGPSTDAAKAPVLAACLVASLYQVAWLRRWVGREAGYFAALFPMLPDVARYSHAILPNIPAVALQAIALYHARRWLERPARSSQLYLGAAAATAAALCYQGATPLILVLAAWVAISGRLAPLQSPRALAVALVAAAPTGAWWAASAAESNAQVGWLVSNPNLGRVVTWHWYTGKVLRAFGAATLALAGLGVVAGPARPRWRREVLVGGSWCLVTYGFFSYLDGKDPRYILPLAPPLLALAAVATLAATRAARPGYRGLAAASLPLAVAGISGWAASDRPMARAAGYGPLAAHVVRMADGGGVLVDSNRGPGDEILIARAMLLDRDFRVRFVRYRDLLYYAGIGRGDDLRAYGATPEGAIAAILERSGCDLVVVDQRRPEGPDPFGDALRAVLGGPSYSPDRPFAIDEPSGGPGRAVVYRRVTPARPTSDFEPSGDLPSPDPGWFRRSPVARPAP